MFIEQINQHAFSLLAQETTETGMQLLTRHLLAAVVFSLVGIAVLIVFLLLIDKLTPFSIKHEIVEEHNQAMGLIIGAIVLGVSLIIAAAILG